MAYQTIPTVSTNQVLTASYLNLLGANIGFVYGVANQSNAPFNSFRSVHVTLDRDIMQWSLRHKVQYLHWKITSEGEAWNYARLYFAGIKLGEGPIGRAWQGVFNLVEWSAFPNFVGVWAAGVAYQDSVLTDGNNGNDDDGSIVSRGGVHYRCKVSHTASAADQPGVGANWTTFWDVTLPPVVNAIYPVWADVNFNAGTEVTVEYILETDAPTF